MVFLFVFAILIASCNSDNQNRAQLEIPQNKEKPKGVLFQLDDVELADTLLKVFNAKKVFENKIGKKILFLPTEHENLMLVSCPNNGLIQTVQECYANHRPLILTPDAIWLTICQGVSIHINENFKALENTLFGKNKPNQIIIRNDSLEYSEKQWKKLIESFSSETKKYTKDDFYSFFVPKFSTTSPVNTTAYQITMLEGYKKAFEYVGETGCGIPSILIAGETKDWQSIYKKLDMLNKIGLTNWADNLKPIIQEFINASENKINKVFWKDIYKDASEYNEYYISGWVIKLFPYIKKIDHNGEYDTIRDEMKCEEKIYSNPFLDGDNYLLSTLSTDNFPSGISKISVLWQNYLKDYSKKIEVHSGFLAMKQYPDKSLEPFISYVICEENAKSTNHNLTENYPLNLKHKNEYWSPNFAFKVIDTAVYNIKKFKTHGSSISYVKKVLMESLRSSSFQRHEYLRDTLEIEILSNGRIGNVGFLKSKNINLNKYVLKVLKDLPEPWFPALSNPEYVLTLMDISQEEAKLKVRVNSKIRIGL